MALEETLASWTGPSSTTEQDKQERSERMIKNAIAGWAGFRDARISVYAKGSYPNNTNVRTDSDVDIAVQCHDAIYWEEEKKGVHVNHTPYAGPWTPTALRSEVEKALRAAFGSQVDASGSIAIKIHSSTARVDADVVPCFDYHYYFALGGHREGTRIFTKSLKPFENFPAQHLTNGRRKNARTSSRFKQAVRIMKRVENAMVTKGIHREVQSFFVESLVYNCPDSIFGRFTWTDRVRDLLGQIWEHTQGDVEPEADRLLEVNECKYLFGPQQPWSRTDARDFAKASWNYLGYAET